MLLSVALSTASRRRGFIPASPPPRRAATVISLMSRVKILPRFASVAAFLCLMFAHLLWPAMVFPLLDRKSTRLNSSHLVISYAVFCFEKKTEQLGPVEDRVQETNTPCIELTSFCAWQHRHW